jgi:hypothetical protein
VWLLPKNSKRSLLQAASVKLQQQQTTVMASTNNAFRGMDGVDSLFKSKAELKAEKAAAKEKKKLEKSKVCIDNSVL